MKSLYKTLIEDMEWDELEVIDAILSSIADLEDALHNGDIYAVDDIIADNFGLEPDYVDDLVHYCSIRPFFIERRKKLMHKDKQIRARSQCIKSDDFKYDQQREKEL